MRAVLINLFFEQMNSSCSIPVTDVFRCLEQRLIGVFSADKFTVICPGGNGSGKECIHNHG